MIPQLIYAGIMTLSLGVIGSKHGHTANKYNGFAHLIVVSLLILLYWWGGFFDKIGAPQLILLGFYLYSAGVAIGKHGESRSNINFWKSLILNAMYVGLLYWGGFFDPFID